MQNGPAYNAFWCFFCYLQDGPVFFSVYRMVLHITKMIIRRTILHITHFSVFHYLQDLRPTYNPNGYMQNGPAYNISQNIIIHPELLFSIFTITSG